MADEYDVETGLHVLRKQPSESLLFDIDLKPRMRTGDAIASITSVTPTNLGKVAGSSNVVTGSDAYSGTVAQTRISGGTDGEHYKITFVVATTAGDTIEGDGMLFVDNL